jgi:hypothetical protein
MCCLTAVQLLHERDEEVERLFQRRQLHRAGVVQVEWLVQRFVELQAVLAQLGVCDHTAEGVVLESVLPSVDATMGFCMTFGGLTTTDAALFVLSRSQNCKMSSSIRCSTRAHVLRSLRSPRTLRMIFS